MPKELLNGYYYITKDNKKDMFYENAYTCIVMNAYMMTKIAKNNNGAKLISSSLDDLTFRLDLTSDEKIDYLHYIN